MMVDRATLSLRAPYRPLADRPWMKRATQYRTGNTSPACGRATVLIVSLAYSRLGAMLPPCSEPSMTLRAASGGGLRPSLTAPARGGVRDGRSGRRDGHCPIEPRDGDVIQAAFACQSVPSRSMALRMTSSLRMQATMMTLGFLPASRLANGGIP